MAGITRRSFMTRTAVTLFGTAAFTAGNARDAAGSRREARRAATQPPVQVVNRGELFVLFGDSTAHGMRGRGFCGIWSLGSLRKPHNAFVSGAAGFIFNSHRGPPVELRRVGAHQVGYALRERGLDSRVLFTVREPHYVDCEATVIPREEGKGPYLLQSWASYINSPRDGDIFFLHEGVWIKAHSPEHGVEATYCPASLKDIEEDLRHLSPAERKAHFIYGYSQQRFSEPFYFTLGASATWHWHSSSTPPTTSASPFRLSGAGSPSCPGRVARHGTGSG